MTETDYVEVGGLRVERVLHDFVNGEVPMVPSFRGVRFRAA